MAKVLIWVVSKDSISIIYKYQGPFSSIKTAEQFACVCRNKDNGELIEILLESIDAAIKRLNNSMHHYNTEAVEASWRALAVDNKRFSLRPKRKTQKLAT